MPRGFAAVTEGAWLPLVPVPFLDESFGSWLRRCAEGYVTTEYEFASAVLALDHKAPPAKTCDWDTEPSAELLESLARRTPYHRAELEYLVAPQGPSLLPRSMRDGYCPQCFADDQPRGNYYTRRAWLDAWSIWCPAHRCLLGEFKREEYQVIPVVTYPGIETLFGDANEHAAQPLRVNPSVASVAIPPTDLTDHPIPWLDRIGVSGWFDPAMLQSVVGRDLMIYMGSAAASGLFSKLFGHGRFWKDLWHDGDRKPHCWPEFIHPIGPIRPRRRYSAKSVLLMTRRNKSSESEMLSISIACKLSPV
jgi:hypothetical protein